MGTFVSSVEIKPERVGRYVLPARLAALVAAPGLAPAPAQQAHARWWIWSGVAAAVVAGGVVTAIALSSPGATTVRAGTLGTLSR